MEDQEFDLCMERMKHGDKDALKEIYVAYLGYIYHLIFSVLQNKENAEDVTSEFFIKLWDMSDRYKPGNGHRAYLGRIAHNMAIDYLRAHNKEIPWDMMEENPESGDQVGEKDAGDNPVSGVAAGRATYSDDTATQVISDISIKEALDKLKPEEREVVHMKVFGEMTFDEISKTLNIPMGTITWRYREAIKKLRRCGFDA